MKIAPAIALLIVGAALCGGALELLLPSGGRQTMEFDEFLATLGTWLMNSFLALASVLKKP